MSNSEFAVTYVDHNGVRHVCSLDEASHLPLTSFHPVRVVSSYKGQPNMPGLYWFATTAEHVLYESRREMRALMMLDFDSDVIGVVAQPFVLVYTGGNDSKKRSHVPDYFASRLDAPKRLVDVKPPKAADKPDVKRVFDATREACGIAGWDYEVVTGHAPTLLANVEWLASYRRPPALLDDTAPVIVEAASGGRSIEDLAGVFRSGIHEALVRPVVMHLLWKRILDTDLSVPLTDSSIVTGGDGSGR